MEWDDDKWLNLIEIYKNKELVVCLDLRNRYSKLVKESQVAKYLSNKANLSCTEIASPSLMLLLRILRPNSLIKYSKSVGFRQVKFL
jgi:hypothetical protein